MKAQMRHRWNLNPAEAIALQRELRDRLILTDQLGAVQRVAGVDVGFEADGTVTRAAVAVLRFPELELLETAIARRPTEFPYIPGLLSFRELPAVLEALEQHGILGGLPVEGGILWCATEKVSRRELDRTVSIVKEVLDR